MTHAVTPQEAYGARLMETGIISVLQAVGAGLLAQRRQPMLMVTQSPQSSPRAWKSQAGKAQETGSKW